MRFVEIFQTSDEETLAPGVQFIVSWMSNLPFIENTRTYSYLGRPDCAVHNDTCSNLQIVDHCTPNVITPTKEKEKEEYETHKEHEPSEPKPSESKPSESKPEDSKEDDKLKFLKEDDDDEDNNKKKKANDDDDDKKKKKKSGYEEEDEEDKKKKKSVYEVQEKPKIKNSYVRTSQRVYFIPPTVQIESCLLNDKCCPYISHFNNGICGGTIPFCQSDICFTRTLNAITNECDEVSLCVSDNCFERLCSLEFGCIAINKCYDARACTIDTCDDGKCTSTKYCFIPNFPSRCHFCSEIDSRCKVDKTGAFPYLNDVDKFNPSLYCPDDYGDLNIGERIVKGVCGFQDLPCPETNSTLIITESK